MKKIKILIIKLGYSETLDSEIGRHVSLGDVLRTTPILSALKEKYKNSHISWLVSEKAEPLLFNNYYIDRLLIWDDFVPFQLMAEEFDVVINLEKVSGICAISDKIKAWNKYGFRFNKETGYYDGHEDSLEFIDYINQKEIGSQTEDCWQKSLIELLNLKWNNQNYILGYKPKSKILYNIGLNYEVGQKWPEKAMSIEKWESLALKLETNDVKISWQKGLDSIYDYIEWINSCETVITQDSLGLHLAIALNKNVIALFGPTSSKEVFFSKNSYVIQSEDEDMEKININAIIKWYINNGK